jgi:transcriptional regulator with XRE-family HTH domain
MMQGSLAESLRILRAQRGLTLTDAAERAGVTRDTLSDLERGKRHAYMPTLAKIAKGYGVPVEDLLEELALTGKAEAPDTGRTARGAALERYKSLRDRLFDIEELGRHEQRAVFDESLQLCKDLLLSDAPTDSERREQNLVLDVLQQATWRILAVWELERERGEGGTDVTNIEEARARLRGIA